MRFSIAQRLAVLATTVALLMTLLVSEFFVRLGRDILNEHEVVDLGDECNLQMHEVQEDLRYLGRELRRFGGQLSGRNHASVEGLLHDPEFIGAWEQGFRQLATLDETQVIQDRPLGQLSGPLFVEARFLSFTETGDLIPSLALKRASGDVETVSLTEPSLAQRAIKDLQSQVLQDRNAGRAARIGDLKQYQSRVLPGESPAGEPAFFALAVSYPVLLGDGTQAGLLVLAVDFTQLIHSRYRNSPRQLLFAVDRFGRFLAHPDPQQTGKTVHDEKDASTEQSRWQFSGLTWGADEAQAEAEQVILDRSQGTRLSEVGLPELQYWHAKKRLDPGFTAGNWERLNRDLDKWADEDSTFRVSKLNDASPSIAISCADRSRLVAARNWIDQQEREANAVGFPWQGDLKCSRFAAHFVPLQLQLGSHEGATGLIFAASLEELASDIDLAAQKIRMWSLLLCLGAGGLALVPAYFLTRPLARINQAAQRLAVGDFSVDLPLRAHGEVGELARSFHHMTEQIRQRDVELRDNLLRLDTILKTAAEGIITFNEQGLIEQSNQAAEVMFGYNNQELVGAKVQALMELPEGLADLRLAEGPLSDSMLVMIKKAFNTPTNVRRGRRKDGSSFWLEASFRDVPLGNRKLVTGVFRDVTRRKEDEERIRLMNEQLEARVRLRTAELEDAKSKLEVALQAAQAASLAKDQFVRTVSHELRTPLSSVLGFAELLLNPRATKLRENPQPTIQKIHTAGKHLLTLINDLLDVARYTSGQRITLEIAGFDLAPFVQGVVEMTTPLLKKNGNQLQVEVEESLGKMEADETRVRQILLNLLGNACKFTEKGTITFRVSREENAELDCVVFTIIDTGAGMTSEQMAGLFKPFYRVDNSTSRRQGGTGLGLSITKMLCEQMGGSVVAHSEPQQGSTFTVRLPAHTPMESAAALESGELRKSGAFKRKEGPDGLPPLKRDVVLVVDDNPMIRELMESFLKREGFRAYSAASGEEGIRIARELRPGTVTLDVVMPGMDGWAVLAALKNDARTYDIPVIMVTIAEDRSRGFSLGAADYLTKPIDWARLHALLRQHCPRAASILVVDDDPLVRDQFCQTLALDGWAIREAANGREALAQVEAEKPQVILLDLMMPLMDGFEFLSALRQRPEFNDVRVVIVTAKELTDEDRQRLEGGVAQILSKGAMASDELLAHLRRQLGSPVLLEGPIGSTN